MLVWFPGLGKSPGEGNGNPLRYSCLENSMHRETWRATQCTGLQRVRHDWVTNTSERLRLFSLINRSMNLSPWRCKIAAWSTTPFQGWGGCMSIWVLLPWGGHRRRKSWAGPGKNMLLWCEKRRWSRKTQSPRTFCFSTKWSQFTGPSDDCIP